MLFGTVMEQLRDRYSQRALIGQSLNVGEREIVSTIERAVSICFTGDERASKPSVWKFTGFWANYRDYGWPAFNRDVLTMRGCILEPNNWPADKQTGLPMLSCTKSLTYHYGQEVADMHTISDWISTFSGEITTTPELRDMIWKIVQYCLVPQTRQWAHKQLSNLIPALKTAGRAAAVTGDDSERTRVNSIARDLKVFCNPDKTQYPFQDGGAYILLVKATTGKTVSELSKDTELYNHTEFATHIVKSIKDDAQPTCNISKTCKLALRMILEKAKLPGGGVTNNVAIHAIRTALVGHRIDYLPGLARGKVSIHRLQVLLTNQNDLSTTRQLVRSVAVPMQTKLKFTFEFPMRKLPEFLENSFEEIKQNGDKPAASAGQKTYAQAVGILHLAINLNDFRVQLALAWMEILSLSTPLPMTMHTMTEGVCFVDHDRPKTRSAIKWKVSLFIKMMTYLYLNNQDKTNNEMIQAMTKIQG